MQPFIPPLLERTTSGALLEGGAMEMLEKALPRRRTSGQLKRYNSSSSVNQSSTPRESDLPPQPLILSGDGGGDLLNEECKTGWFTWRSTLILGVCLLVVCGYAVSNRGRFDLYSRSLRQGSHDLSEYHRTLTDAGISDYELVPEIKTSRSHVGRALQASGDNQINIDLSVLDTEYQLTLERADQLFSNGYKHTIIYKDGREEVNDVRPSCVYHASITGDPDSFGVVSLCDDSFHASLFHRKLADKEFTVAPLSDDVHVIYRQSSLASAGASVKRNLRPCPMDEAASVTNKRVLDDSPWSPVGSQNKTVKVLVVNDAKRYKQHGKKVAANTIAIMSAVNAFYEKLTSTNMYGIQFELLPQITFAEKDGWSEESVMDNGAVDSQKTLNEFYEWKKTLNSTQADLVYLFSGNEFQGGFVGRSAQAGSTADGVCTERNVGVCQTSGFDIGLYAKIVAHELGHSLSLPHDNTYDDPACKADSNTFMWSGISLGQGTKFTPCSVQAMRDFFEGRTQFTYKGCVG